VRLLFVHEVNWRAKVVYEIHDYPELLSLAEHEVVFIDFPEGETRSGFSRFLDLRTRVRKGQTRAHEGSSVEVRTPGRVLPAPLDRLLASVTYAPAIWRALKHEKFDAVILYGAPTNGWQTVWIANRLGVPVIFRAIDVAHVLRKSIFKPLIKQVEHYIYRSVDHVSANNVALREYCVRYGADPSTTTVQYPGLDLKRFSPGERDSKLLKRYHLEPHHQVVMFMGTLYRFAGLEVFISLFADFLRSNSNVRLVILGGGEFDQKIRTLVKDLNLQDKVIMPGFIDYDELPAHLRLATVAINPFEPSTVTNCALPWKVVQYLACALPVVCTPLDGLRGLVADGDGITYRNLDESFTDAVINLLSDDAARLAQQSRARAAIETACNWDSCLKQFTDMITDCVDAS